MTQPKVNKSVQLLAVLRRILLFNNVTFSQNRSCWKFNKRRLDQFKSNIRISPASYIYHKHENLIKNKFSRSTEKVPFINWQWMPYLSNRETQRNKKLNTFTSYYGKKIASFSILNFHVVSQKKINETISKNANLSVHFQNSTASIKCVSLRLRLKNKFKISNLAEIRLRISDRFC